MFGVGMPELLLIFVIALLVFGPKELPRLAKSLGHALAHFKRASDEFQETIRAEMEALEEEARRPATAVTPDVSAAAGSAAAGPAVSPAEPGAPPAGGSEGSPAPELPSGRDAMGSPGSAAPGPQHPTAELVVLASAPTSWPQGGEASGPPPAPTPADASAEASVPAEPSPERSARLGPTVRPESREPGLG